MGLFDWMETKETRKDARGREYIYNLTTKEVTRKEATHTDRLGWADNSEKAREIASKDKSHG
jgi:hypothetical protein